MGKATSLRLTEEAEAALAFLKTRMGGFNLQQSVNQVIIEEANRQGWRWSQEGKEI